MEFYIKGDNCCQEDSPSPKPNQKVLDTEETRLYNFITFNVMGFATPFYQIKMRVLLICPQYTDLILPHIASDSFYHFSESVSRFRRPSAATVVPIGLSYIESALALHHDVKLLYQDVAASDIAGFAPDVVGISSILSLQESITFELARFVKQIKSNTKVVVGGTHPTALPERMLANEHIDYVILGEGEYSMLELTNCLQNRRDLNHIDGLAFKRNESTIVNPKTVLIENLDELPIPSLIFDEATPKAISGTHAAWNKATLLSFAIDSHRGMTDQVEKTRILERRKNSFKIRNDLNSTESGFTWKTQRVQCLVTSRGCPFDCSYCTSQMMWKKRYRTRSLENLVEEVRRFPAPEVLICDENMTLDAERAKRFFEAIAPLKKKFFFYNGIDPYTLDDQLIKLMKDAGVTKISISIESGSLGISRQIRRRFDFEKVVQVLSALKRNRILTAVYFIIGFPGETEADIQQTIDIMTYCMVNFPVIVHVFKFLLLPGSRLYEEHCGEAQPDFEKYCFFPIEDYKVFRLNDSVAIIPRELDAFVRRSKLAMQEIKRGDDNAAFGKEIGATQI